MSSKQPEEATPTPVLGNFIISITGHRPGDLRSLDGKPLTLEEPIADLLDRAAKRAQDGGYSGVHVITGGALGTDQAVAAAVYDLGARGFTPGMHKGIAFTYEVVLPFPIEVMAKRWRQADRERLELLCQCATEVVGPVSPTFAFWAYHQRNQLMVQRSMIVIAFWSGKASGGTFACIQYALKKAKPPRPVYNALMAFAPVRLPEPPPTA